MPRAPADVRLSEAFLGSPRSVYTHAVGRPRERDHTREQGYRDCHMASPYVPPAKSHSSFRIRFRLSVSFIRRFINDGFSNRGVSDSPSGSLVNSVVAMAAPRRAAAR